MHALIGAVGLDQTREGLARERALVQRGLQAHEQRVLGAPLKRAVEVSLQLLKRGQAVARGGVAELVDQACEAVDRQQVRAHTPGQQPARDREVLAPGARHHGAGAGGGGRRPRRSAHPSDRQRPSALIGNASR